MQFRKINEASIDVAEVSLSLNEVDILLTALKSEPAFEDIPLVYDLSNVLDKFMGEEDEDGEIISSED